MIVLSEGVVFIWAMLSLATLIMSLMTELHFKGTENMTMLSLVMFLGMSFAFPSGMIMIAAYWWQDTTENQ